MVWEDDTDDVSLKSLAAEIAKISALFVYGARITIIVWGLKGHHVRRSGFCPECN